MKATIERDQCICCGVCWSECPEVFEEDQADGKSRITERYRISGDGCAGEAPETLRDSCTAAAEGCPVAIIHLE